MKKRRIIIGSLASLVMVLILSLLGACSANQATTSAPAVTSAPASTSAAETINLVVNCYNTQVSPTGAMMDAWTKKIEEQSGGKVKFTLNYNSALFSPSETLKSLAAGVADIQIAFTGREDSGKMVLNSFWQVPFWGFQDAQSGTKIFTDLLTNNTALKEEYQGLKIYAPLSTKDIHTFSTVNKPILTAADLKGMKIFAAGLEAKYLDAAGAVPVEVGFMDIYSSLEKGLLDGTMLGGGPIMGTGTLPLYKYHTTLTGDIMIPAFQTQLINQKTWDKLPADIQKIFTDLEPWYQEQAVAMDSGADFAILKQAQDMGHTVGQVPASEVVILKSIATPLQEEWISSIQAKGKPGKALIEELNQLLAQYSTK